MTRREIFRGALAALGARLLPVALLTPLAVRVAQGPGERGMAMARRFGAVGFSQPGLDYAQRTGFIGYFTDKSGRVVGWLDNAGRVYRSFVHRAATLSDQRGWETPIKQVGRAW